MHMTRHVSAIAFNSLQHPEQCHPCRRCRQSTAARAVYRKQRAIHIVFLGGSSAPTNIITRQRTLRRSIVDDFSKDLDTHQRASQAPRIKGSRTAASQQLSLAPPLKAPLHDKPVADFKFWHDEKRFRGCGDVSLAQHVLLAAGGTRMGGNFKEAKTQGHMGWQVPNSWDLLWSTSDGALKAAPFIQPGQLISTLPGMDCITKKRHLAVTLAAAYREDAWRMLPRTYSIPSQLQQFRQRLRDEAAAMAASAAAAPDDTAAAAAAAAAGPVTGYYVLKTGEHLGQGIKIVPSSKALSALLERNKPYLTPPVTLDMQHPTAAQAGSSSSSSSNSDSSLASRSSGTADNSSKDSSSSTSGNNRRGAIATATQQQQQHDSAAKSNQAPTAAAAALPRPFICAQQYITNPLLINGCKFGLRLWVAALGPKPYRAYLYSEGLVLFSKERYNADMDAVVTCAADAEGHLTNAAQNQTGDVWLLSQLLGLLGQEAAQQLQQQLAATAGKVVAAAGPAVHSAAQALHLPEQTCAFELLGLDFLLDSALHPWLLEVNASPSLAWEHARPHTAALMRRVKTDMLIDMVALLRLQDRFPLGGAAQQQQEQQQQQQQQQQQTDYELASGTSQLPPPPPQQQQKGYQETASDTSQQQPRQQQEWQKQIGPAPKNQTAADFMTTSNISAGANPLLFQAASAQYFAARPYVLQLVMEDAQQLQAAVAAAPCKSDVQQQVQGLLQHWQQLAGLQQNKSGSGSTRNSSDADTLHTNAPTGSQAIIDDMTELEAEMQSARGWQSLLTHMVDACKNDDAAGLNGSVKQYWLLARRPQAGARLADG